MKKFLIAPSILSADFACLGQDIKNVLLAGSDLIHFDAMDNHYVQNLTIGPLVLKSLRNCGITVPIDVHLMVKPIDNLIVEFAKVGASHITFHPETSENINRSIRLIKDNKCKAGLAFNIETSLCYLNNFINTIDIIVLMAVNPGFPGQKLIPNVFKKIIKVRKLIDKSGNNILLGVDGGINIDNIYKIASLGVDLFIIGSAIFNSKNYKLVINTIRKKLLKVKNEKNSF